MTDMRFSAPEDALTLRADVLGENIFGEASCTAYLRELSNTRDLWTQLPVLVPTMKASLAERLQPLGSTRSSGSLHYSKKLVRADLACNTEAGEVHLKGTLTDKNHFQANLALDDAHLEAFLNNNAPAQPLALTASATLEGQIRGAEGRPEVQASGRMQSFTFRQHTYHDIPFSGSVHGHEYQLALQVSEEEGGLSLDAQASLPPTGTKRITLNGQMERFNPSALRLTKALSGESISGQIEAQMALPANGQPE